MCAVATQYTTGPQVPTYFHLPNLERVRRWICGHPSGTEITTSVRRLARAVGCGAAAITPALRRMAADGLIEHLSAPSGTFIQVLVSDAGAAPGDQAPDHCPTHPAASPSAPLASEEITPLITRGGDHDPDRPMSNMVHADSSMQQQHASASDSADGEKPPVGLTPTEWQTIRALVPGYGEAQLRADLAKLKQRPGIRNPVGVLIAAYRRGEPVWGRGDLQAHNAAVTAQHVPPAADPPPPRRARPGPAPVAAPASPALHAPHGALWDHLLLLVPDAELVDWLCDGFALEVQAEATVLHCRQADHALVARDLRGLLIDALRDIGLPDVIEIRAPEENEQAVRDAEHTLSAPSVVNHALAPGLPAPAQPSAPEARPVPPPTLADHAQPPTPPAPPVSTAPSARAAPPGVADRPRRPRWSPWRAS